MPNPVQIEGLRNGVQYGDLLFAGQASPGALRALADQGYATVVNTRGEGEVDFDEAELVESLGMEYHAIAMNKPVTEITDAWVGALADILKSSPRPILLHCGSGNRVSGLYAVWLVEHEGLSPADALERATQVGMTRVRPVVEKRLGEAPAGDGS